MRNSFFRYAILASAFLLPGGSVLADTLLTSDVYMSASTADDVVQQLKTRYKTSRVAARFHNKLKYFEVSATYTDGTGVTFLCNAGGEELLKMPSGTEYNVFVRGGKLHFRTAQLMVNTDCHIVHDFTDTFQHIMDADARWTCVNDYGSLDKNRAACLMPGVTRSFRPAGMRASVSDRRTAVSNISSFTDLTCSSMGFMTITAVSCSMRSISSLPSLPTVRSAPIRMRWARRLSSMTFACAGRHP